MPTPADRTIRALRTGHDHLAAKVAPLSRKALGGPSGAAEWSIAQVLSHLGSGAEIHSAMLDREIEGAPEAAPDANQRVWDRWNAMSPGEQVDAFIGTNGRLVSRYEALDEHTRASTEIDLGFLPAPVPVVTAAGYRLNEFTLHAWDVEVGTDPGARLAQDAVEQLLDIAPHMLGWLGKPDVLDGRRVNATVRFTDLGREFGFHLDDSIAVTETPEYPNAILEMPAESWLRMLFGRLGPAHTPAEVVVTGAITLDELREVFPGI